VKDLTVLHADVCYLGTRHPGSSTQFPFHALATLCELPLCLSLPCPARTDLLPSLSEEREVLCSRHSSRSRPYHHPQTTCTQTQSQQLYMHVSPTPCPTLSCLISETSTEPHQTLSQGTSFRLAPHCRAEDRR